MAQWPAKDPDAVLDYVYPIPLDPSDSVSSYSLTKLSGSVVVDNEDRDGANVTVWLSGGTDGETAVFRIAWETAGGRIADDIITLSVVQNGDLPSGFATPSPAQLIARYPAFAAVPTATIAYWIKDALRIVKPSWIEEDFSPAVLALAGHNMALGGLGVSGDAGAMAGVTRFRSASMDVSFTERAANAGLDGGYEATRYGQEFRVFLRRNAGGLMLMGCP